MLDPWVTHHVNTAGQALAMIDRQWLLSNGTGAYAMGTLPGINTHRYHGLLIAAASPPVGRIMALNQLGERLQITTPQGQRTVELATCAFRDDQGQATYVPDGYTKLIEFERGTTVAWTYAIGPVRLRRQLLLHWKQQAATIEYTVTGLDQPAILQVDPMVSLRDFHGLLRRAEAGPFKVAVEDQWLCVEHDETAVTFGCPDARVTSVEGAEQWWYDMRYDVDTARGQGDCEDYFVPGRFEFDLPANKTSCVTLTVALGREACQPELSANDRYRELDRAACHGCESPDQRRRMLVMAAGDCVVDRQVGQQQLSTILAGYPWFADWGRDTFIALPGLLLSTGRFDEARDVLHAYALSIKGGLIPNRFDDYDQSSAAAHYNTLDASLWFVHSAMAYLDASDDRDAWHDWLAAAALQIIDAYIKGTSTAGPDADSGAAIGVAGDGLIVAGSTRTQLTWMDAACEGVVFTPRQGKAVEINALWYHVLIGMSRRIEGLHPRHAEHYKRLAARTKRAFVKVFWDEQLGYLCDHVWTDEQGDEQIDRSLRPNQIFAASLPDTPMPRTKQVQMLASIRQHLLTPCGLRTLPIDDPQYHGTYAGPAFERDKAYHQGTVWPWLIGPYAEAILRVGRFSTAAKEEARAALEPLLQMLAGEGPYSALGQLHEIHDGDEPHHPRGCIAQAWSIAEVLRVSDMVGK
jgi:predicted glycogen debranching enzyme